MVNHQILSESEAELGGVQRDEIGWNKLQQDGPRAHGPYKIVRDIKVAPIKNGRKYISYQWVTGVISPLYVEL